MAEAKRKLMAILAADVVGYSRLMGDDEQATMDTLNACRGVFRNHVGNHDGRVVDTAGDSVLAVFDSVVEAIESASEVQAELMTRNADLPEDRRMLFRIGVNLGDIIAHDDGTIYGDGVNVAARLEALADPNGICISQSAHMQADGKLDLVFEDIGEHEVKNIAKPVRVYRVAGNAEAAQARKPTAETASKKPSIAVIPFDNMTNDTEQEFFADGLTEDIITELSRFRDLFVISRNSSFVYKGQAKNLQVVAKELNVEYLVEGSVRKAGSRVRVTVQLIDAETDRHIWAERYDRQLEDIFDIQDEIASSIVATLPGRVAAATHERAERKLPENMSAYEHLLSGRRLHHRATREDNSAAMSLLERAIELEPRYAHAHAWRACVLGQSWVHGWREDASEEVARELKIALALDDNDADVHRILAALAIMQDNHDQSAYHQERALGLNPNDDLIVVQQGEVLTWLGRPEEGIEWIEKAMRLNPFHPERFWSHLGRAFFVAHRYREAVEAFNHVTEPVAAHHAFLAASHAQLDEPAAARSNADKVLRNEPDFTIESYLATLHYKQEEDLAHHRDALLKAGLPIGVAA
jgi:adenylate cyclase